MTTINFIAPVHESILKVEELMRSQANGYHPDLQKALEHLLSSGGKRIRPAITILSGRMLAGPEDKLIILAAAIELLHTATLVHDDMIDNALLRRGIPTLNSQWSPGATILTGDFMFARAAKLAAETDSIEVMKLYSNTLTTIVNGEITQLFSNHFPISRQEYFDRIYAKTASLFETSTKSAALVSKVDHEIIANLQRFGYQIGMAFQIIDDILDFTGEQATIGKPVGSDLRQGLITLPAIIYFEDHPDDPAAHSLQNGSWYEEESIQFCLINTIRSSGAIDSAHKIAESFVHKGLEILNQLPRSIERQSLEDITLNILSRQF